MHFIRVIEHEYCSIRWMEGAKCSTDEITGVEGGLGLLGRCPVVPVLSPLAPSRAPVLITGCEEVGVANTIEHRLPLILWAAASDLLLSACVHRWNNIYMVHRCFSCSFLSSSAAFSLVSLELSPQNCAGYHTTTESSIREAIALFYSPYSLHITSQYPLLRLIICIWK